MTTIDNKNSEEDVDIDKLKISQLIDESYVARRVYWPAYTWLVQTSYSSIITKNETKFSTRLPEINKDSLINHISDLFNKVNATFYHLQQLKASEKKAVEMGLKLASISSPGFEKSIGIAGSYYEPTLYEYEALLVDAKTALDILTITIAKSIGRKEDSIVSLLHNLDQVKKLSTIETELKVVLNKFSIFIDTFIGNVSKRNYAVHNGSLPIGTINVPINNPRAPIIKSKAYDPHKPISDQTKGINKTMNLHGYCENTFYSMADIVVDCLEILLNTKFKKGPKISLQEEKEMEK